MVVAAGVVHGDGTEVGMCELRNIFFPPGRRRRETRLQERLVLFASYVNQRVGEFTMRELFLTLTPDVYTKLDLCQQ